MPTAVDDLQASTEQLPQSVDELLRFLAGGTEVRPLVRKRFGIAATDIASFMPIYVEAHTLAVQQSGWEPQAVWRLDRPVDPEEIARISTEAGADVRTLITRLAE